MIEKTNLETIINRAFTNLNIMLGTKSEDNTKHKKKKLLKKKAKKKND
tara:strand:- start:527 stop:670 length:144 start_codon:yes stop_codon:yes gene_type:complete